MAKVWRILYIQQCCIKFTNGGGSHMKTMLKAANRLLTINVVVLAFNFIVHRLTVETSIYSVIARLN